MNIAENLKELRKKNKITQGKLAADFGVSNAAVAMWESAQRTPPADLCIKLAAYFGVSVDSLFGIDVPQPENIIHFPVLIGIHAGFGNGVEEIGSGDYQEIPRGILKGRKEEDFIVFRVEGDSMFPKFLDGDHVLVLKTPSVNSGDVAIVCYENFQNGTIKKVLYEPGCDYLDLIPLNPKYAPIRIQGEKLEGTRVIGQVVYLFRKI